MVSEFSQSLILFACNLCSLVMGIVTGSFYAEIERQKLKSENLDLRARIDGFRRSEIHSGAPLRPVDTDETGLPKIQLREPVPEW